MKHVIQKLGAGVGLMATSMVALAGNSNISLHTFGDSMVFAKSGTTPVYATFVPSGNQSTDYVLLLELTQGSGTAPGTWQYFVSSQNLGAYTALGGASTGSNVGMVYSIVAHGGTTSAVDASSWSTSASTATSTFAGGFAYTWYGPVGNGSTSTAGANATSNGEVVMPFSFSTGISTASATCDVSFGAYVGTNDHMNYYLQNVSASNALNGVTDTINTLSNSYTFTTKSGGTTSDTVTGSYTTGQSALQLALMGATQLAIGASSTYGSTSFPVPAYTYVLASVTGAHNETFSIGSGPLKQIAACAGVANSRLALNSNGLVVGGALGMIRLW